MEKLIKVQQELKAPKNQYNKFGKYNYRNAEDILEAVKPLLSKHGLLMIISDEPIQMGERIYIMATVTIIDGDKKLFVQALAREPEAQKGMSESQITGAASSYARKYALNGMFCIDDTKDADSQDNTDKKEAPKAKALPPLNEKSKHWDYTCNQYAIGKIDLETIKKSYTVSESVADALNAFREQEIENADIKQEYTTK